MEAPPKWKIEDLIAEIEKSPGKYSSDAIVSILSYLKDNVVKQHGKLLSVKFANSRNSAFATNRFASVYRLKDEINSKKENVVLEGGAFNMGDVSSPFPAELFDELLKDLRGGNKLALEFLDIFVDRLSKIDFFMRDKITLHQNAYDTFQKPTLKMVERLATIQEKFIPMPNKLNHIKFSNLKTYSFRKPISAHVTKRILQNLFGCKVQLEQNTLRYLDIPASARFFLSSNGVGNLGSSSFIGRYKPTVMSGIDVQVRDLYSGDVDALMTEPAFITNMCVLFRAIYPFPLRIELKLFRNSGKGSILGKKSILGRNTWINAKEYGYTPVILKFNSWEN